MSPEARLVFVTFCRVFRAHFGRPPRVRLKRGSSTPFDVASFENLIPFLKANNLDATSYFAVVFEWAKSRNLDTKKQIPTFFCSKPLQQTALWMLRQLRKRNRRPLAVTLSPLASLKERVQHDIKMQLELLKDLLQHHPDPVRARTIGVSSFSPYFWCFDPYWGDPHIQKILPPTLKQSVLGLWLWFLENPDLTTAAQEAYNEHAARLSLSVRSTLSVQDPHNPDS